MAAEIPSCGTRQAVNRHRSRREPLCEACRTWWNAYVRSRPSGRARSRALTALTKAFPVLYAGLLDEERAKRGLPPNRSGSGQRPDLSSKEFNKLGQHALRAAQRELARQKRTEFKKLLAAENRRVRQEDLVKGAVDRCPE